MPAAIRPATGVARPFHFVCQQGIENLTDAEAEQLIGRDRETHQRDLLDAIDRKDFPRWKLRVQIMPERNAASYSLNPFDLTKVWPHKDYPLIDVGVMELQITGTIESTKTTTLNLAHYFGSWTLGSGWRFSRIPRDRWDAHRKRCSCVTSTIAPRPTRRMGSASLQLWNVSCCHRRYAGETRPHSSGAIGDY